MQQKKWITDFVNCNILTSCLFFISLSGSMHIQIWSFIPSIYIQSFWFLSSNFITLAQKIECMILCNYYSTLYFSCLFIEMITSLGNLIKSVFKKPFYFILLVTIFPQSQTVYNFAKDSSKTHSQCFRQELGRHLLTIYNNFYI